MRRYTTVSYDRNAPQVKMICALQPAPVPPPPPPPAVPLTISGSVTLDSVLVEGIAVDFSGVGQYLTQTVGLDVIYQGTVPAGYSGTVTPEYAAYPLAYDVTPGSRVYTDLAASQINQDFDITSKVYTVSGTYGDDTPTEGGLADFFITNGTQTWVPDISTGSYGFDVLGGWSGSIASAQYITDPGSHAFTSVTADQTGNHFLLPTPFATIFDATMSWSWTLENPDRWLIFARHPVTMVYWDYGTVAGSISTFDTAPSFGTFFGVIGIRNSDSQYQTLASNEVLSSSPVT